MYQNCKQLSAKKKTKHKMRKTTKAYDVPSDVSKEYSQNNIFKKIIRRILSRRNV